MKINFRFLLSKSWKALLMGVLVAVGIALFPQVQCAIAQTCNSPADRWCGSGKCCSYTGGMRVPASCTNRNMTKTYPYRCNPEIGNCNVSDWMGYPYQTRTTRDGRTQAKIPECDWKSATWLPEKKWPWVYVDCCGGGGGGCTPQYAPPTIEDGYTVDPPNPIVWTQEQPPYGLALVMTMRSFTAA